MRKIFISSLFIFLILAGCSNDDAYNNVIQKGLDYIASEEYQKAESAFEIALDEKKNDEKATAILEQTVYYQEALKAMDEGEIESAKEKAEKVINIKKGSSALIKKSEDMVASINEFKVTLTEITEEYEAALKQFEEKKYKEAEKKVDNILKNDLEHPIFKSIKNDTKKLQKNIESALEAEEQSELEKEEQAKAKEKKVEKENAEKEYSVQSEENNKENSGEKLSLDKMRNFAKQYVDEWNGYDNTLTEEDWLEDGMLRYYIFQDGPTQHEVGVIVNSKTGEVRGDYGGID